MICEHYKGGRYRVLFDATDSTNGRNDEDVVVYVSLSYGAVRVRTFTEFHELVTWPDGTRAPRFVRCHD